MGGSRGRTKTHKIVWLENKVHRALTVYQFHLSRFSEERLSYSKTIEYLLKRALLLDRFIVCAKRNPTNIYSCFEDILGDIAPVLDREGRESLEAILVEREVW